MNTLRLETINLHAPYTVKQREDKPQHYYFRTDYGVEYESVWKKNSPSFQVEPMLLILQIENISVRRSIPNSE